MQVEGRKISVEYVLRLTRFICVFLVGLVMLYLFCVVLVSLGMGRTFCLFSVFRYAVSFLCGIS